MNLVVLRVEFDCFFGGSEGFVYLFVDFDMTVHGCWAFSGMIGLSLSSFSSGFG